MVHRIALRDLPSTSALLADLWSGAEGYRRLVPRHFLQPRAFEEQARLVREGSYPRAELSAILARQNEKLNAGPKALAAAASLAQPGSLVVIGGQQAGLFGGPLYTVHKALTILDVARRMEKRLGAPVVPVFWIASEDSDIAEIDHAWISDAAGSLRSLRLPSAADGKVPVSRIRLGEGVGALVDEMAGSLGDGGFAAETLAALRSAYAAGRTFPQAFGAWMAWLFHDTGLVLADPSDDALKRLAHGLFEREIREKSPVSAAVIEQTAKLRAAGYEPQIELREGLLTLFHQDPARDAIALHGERFELKSTGRLATADELVAELREHPDHFTPNATLRPLFQDSVFPVLAVALGPAEIAYYTQLTAAYERLGVCMPLLLPRATLTIVEQKIETLRAKLDVPVGDVIRRGERVVDDILRREVPASLASAVASGRSQAAASWETVLAEIDRLDPTLHRTVEVARARSTRPYDFMEKKIAQAARRRSDVLRGQVTRLVNGIAPRGALQERTLSALPFLCRHGRAGLDALAAAIDPFAAEHRALVVSA
jgi:bacillithiol synthase